MAAIFLAGAAAPRAGGYLHHAARVPGVRPLYHRLRPWAEGVTPPLENRLFAATYRVLPSHNVLKVYVFDAGGYQSAGIRFSARVPHTAHDLNAEELDSEAARLIRTTFERFPEIQTLDVWATIPVSEAQQTSVENTVFSVSADRATFDSLRAGRGLSDAAFLEAFGHVWLAPEVPRT
ncbi:MAG: hypothetical protein M3Z37_02875 [Candidatus Eremiobacteraeota bacterium]|nr:hypothetical protein [Candidatus Eremiobacteraeota bacterium]